MTPAEIKEALADGTFFATLMDEVRITPAQGERPGTIELTLAFPRWFDEHLDEGSRRRIVERVRAAAQLYES